MAVFAAPQMISDLPPILEGVLFAVLLAVMLWSAFGVTEEAEHLAGLLREPLGTMILTLAIVVIEVALIAAVMLGGKDAPTLGRDTMFAVLMCVLNGIVGAGLLLGGFRHGEQAYNLQGASAYLSVIIPLSVITFILPNYTLSTAAGTLSAPQEIAFSVFTLLLYGIFLSIQTGRHRAFFMEPILGDAAGEASGAPLLEQHDAARTSAILRHAGLLVVSILPIVLLSKKLAVLIEHGLAATALPAALGGVLIALLVLAPEGITALRAVSANQLQRGINLCLGAAASTIGLTVPAVVTVSIVTGQTIVLGLSPAEMILLAMTLILCTLTFSGPRTTILEGAMHLVIFFVYLTLIFAP